MVTFITLYVMFLSFCGILKIVLDLPIVIITDYWFTAGTTIGPFIILQKKYYSRILLNHEIIHYQQQLEMGFLLAYIWYAAEYLIKLIIYRNFTKAYERVSFEREAFAAQNITGYLSVRPLWRVTRYIFGMPNLKK